MLLEDQSQGQQKDLLASTLAESAGFGRRPPACLADACFSNGGLRVSLLHSCAATSQAELSLIL